MYLSVEQRKQLFGETKMKDFAKKTIEISSKIGTHTVHIIEPSKLNDTQSAFLFSQCAQVALDAFSQNESEKWEEDIRSHVLEEPVLYVVMSEGTLRWRGSEVSFGEGRSIAWCSMRYIETSRGKMAYVSGIAVSTAFAGKGIGQNLMKEAFKGCNVFSLRTQSPIMAQAFHRAVKNCQHVYPFDQYQESQEFAQEISEKLEMSNIDHKLMFSNVYGGTLYGVTQKSKDNFGNEIFNPEMQKNGDAYLCLAL